MVASLNTISAPELMQLQSAEELVMYAREQRERIGVAFALSLIRKLATVLHEYHESQKALETCSAFEQTQLAQRMRAKVQIRVLLKELGIWCYLAYTQGADERFLNQAKWCLTRLCNTYGSDVEAEMYLAFTLWSKWNLRKAQPGDMKRCFTLLSHCAEADPLAESQLDAVWFRLGYLYQVGVGCKKNKDTAQYCYAQARQYGLDC